MTASKLTPGDPFKVVMLLYPGVTQLDFTGPADAYTNSRYRQSASMRHIVLRVGS